MPAEKTKFDPNAKLVQVRREIHVEPSWEVDVMGEHEGIALVKIDVVYDDTLRRYAATTVKVQRAGDGTEITGSLLREIKVGERVQRGALQRMWLPRVESPQSLNVPRFKRMGDGWLYTAADILRLHAPMEGRANDEYARDAAYIYDIATVAYMPPLQTISKTLETSQSTAKRLVARARDIGALDGDD